MPLALRSRMQSGGIVMGATGNLTVLTASGPGVIAIGAIVILADGSSIVEA